jgi:hypothetical protein
LAVSWADSSSAFAGAGTTIKAAIRDTATSI